MDEQSRRTNILVGNEVLHQIDDSQNVTHQNGVMRIEINTLPAPLSFGNYMQLSWDAIKRALSFKYLQDAWKTVATTEDLAGLSVTWDNLSGKPGTFPADEHQHSRQRLCLPVVFEGTLSPGMARSVVLPIALTSAQLLNISFALGTIGSAGYTSFGLDAWVYDETAQTERWTSYIVNPADPPMAIVSGGYPKDFIGVPDKVSMGKMTLPKAELTGNDWLRVTILQAATGAEDAALMLEFDATFEAFDAE